MNYHEVEERIKAGYREVTAQYRLDDEVEVQSENHRRLAGTLKRLCRLFPYPIAVLDVGCGTGRYFHCLENVSHLTGIDISEQMLAAAANPVRQQEITVTETVLSRENAYLVSFPADSFDLIYSLGMFGHGCPVTVQITNRFCEWLKPGGILFFDIVDFDGLPWWYRTRRRARGCLYPLLPRTFKRMLDRREERSPFFGLTKGQLEEILGETRLDDFTVNSHECKSPLWTGRHLECLATKPRSASPVSLLCSSRSARSN